MLDQNVIWTSPAHAQSDGLKWLVPSSGIAAGLLLTDPDISFGMASRHPNTWEEVPSSGPAAALGSTAAIDDWGPTTSGSAKPGDWRWRL